jgi:tetratricopeptide (TPR) repeat protein
VTVTADTSTTNLSSTAPDLETIKALYENGLLLQAYNAGVKLFGPELRAWQPTAARVIGLRLAGHLGADSLAQWLAMTTYRAHKTDPEARFYYAYSVFQRRGPIAALAFVERIGSEMLPGATASLQASWQCLQALIYGTLRDFDTADAYLARADRANPNDAWVSMERSTIRMMEDRYDEALEAANEMLRLKPWHRAGVQAKGHLLTLLGRDDEAMALLTEATARMEVPAIGLQLVALQLEHQQYSEAKKTLDQVETLYPASLLSQSKSLTGEIEEDEDSLAGLRSGILYHLGDYEGAIAAARNASGYFYQVLAERMAQGGVENRTGRVLLPVGFVRQHHMTCAPATLTALSRYWNQPADHLAVVEDICYAGTSSFNERRWAVENGWLIREFTLTMDSARALLDRGVPFTLATINTGNGHLQAVIGYDDRRQTLLLRDPYYRNIGEALGPELLKQQSSSGPRGMAMVPLPEAHRLDGLELPDTTLYDLHYAVLQALEHHVPADAETALRIMEANAPDHYLTLRGRWYLSHYNGDATTSLATVRRLIELFPDDANLQLAHLSLLRELSRREERIEVLEQLVTSSPKRVRKDQNEATEVTTADENSAARRFDPIYWQQFAEEIRNDAREQDRALYLLQQVLRYSPTDSHSLYLKAEILWSRREFTTALALYRWAACQSDTDERFAWGYYKAARYLKRTEEVLSFLKGRFTRFRTRSPRPGMTLYRALFDLDRTTEAFQILDEALEARPYDGDLLVYIAEERSRFGQFARAQQMLHRATGHTAESSLNRAKAHLVSAQGDSTAAAEIWRKILQSEPLAMDAHYALAQILSSTEGNTAVNAHFQQATVPFPHHFGLHRLWADQMDRDTNSDHDLRLTVLDKLVHINPADAWTRRERGFALCDAGKPQQAFEEAKLAYSIEPHAPAVFAIRGRVCMAANQYADALEAFRDAVRLSADFGYAITQVLELSDSPVKVRESLVFLEREIIRSSLTGDGIQAFRRSAGNILKPSELAVIMERIRNARPDLSYAWSALTLQQLDADRTEEALNTAREATQRFPLIPGHWVDLARVQEARHNSAAERSALEQALQIAPYWSPALRALCDLLERDGKSVEAKALLQASVRREPLRAETHGSLALVLWKMGEKENAISAMKQAVTLQPDADSAWQQLMHWCSESGKADEVIALAREMTSRRSTDASAYLTLAQILPEGPAHLEERLSLLRECIARDPRSVEAHNLYAVVLTKAGRYQEATAACRPAAFGTNVPSELTGRAAWIQAEQGDLVTAIRRMRNVVDANPNFWWGWRQLTQWYQAQGLDGAPAAVAAAKRCTEIRPQDAVSWGYLGDARLKTRDRAGAKAALTRALDLMPDYTWAGFALLDMQIDDNELAEANRTLTTLETGLPEEPYVPAFGVRLGVARKSQAEAFRQLSRLCFWSGDDSDLKSAFENALYSIQEANWLEAATNHLTTILREEKVHSEAARALVLCCLQRRDTTTVEQWLPYLRSRGDLGIVATAQYLKNLGNQGNVPVIRSMYTSQADYLRSDDRTWSAMGYALISISDPAGAAAWTRDWESRKNVSPTDLLNRVTALRETGRAAEATSLSLRALERADAKEEEDENTRQLHHLWLALDAAMQGNIADMDRYLAGVTNHSKLPEYYAFIYHLVLAMQRAAKRDARAFNEAREILTRAVHSLPSGNKTDPYLRSLYQNAVRRIADTIGTAPAKIWAVTASRL